MSDNLRRALFGNSRRRPSATEIIGGAVLDQLTNKNDRQPLPADPNLPPELHGVIQASDYRIRDRGHDTECWIWDKNSLVIRDPISGRLKDANEVVYRAFAGRDVPKDSVILNRCGRKKCINYEHFSIVTKTEANIIGRIGEEFDLNLTNGNIIVELSEKYGWTENDQKIIFRTSVLSLGPALDASHQYNSVITASEREMINEITGEIRKGGGYEAIPRAHKEKLVELAVSYDWWDNDVIGVLFDREIRSDQFTQLKAEVAGDDAQGYIHRAEAKRDLRDHAGAIVDYDQAILLAPNNAEAYSSRARVKYTLNDYAGAIADLDQSITHDPDNERDWSFRGSLKTKLEDYAGAITDYDQAIVLEPSDVWAHIYRGNAKAELEDYAGSIADYDQAIALDPDDGRGAYTRRGNVKAKLGDYIGAIADYNLAIKNKPRNAAARFQRGNVKAELGDYVGAIADYDEAIKRYPDGASHYRAFRDRAKAALEGRTVSTADVETETAPEETAAIPEPEPPSSEPDVIELDYPPEPDNPLAPNIQPEPEPDKPLPPEPETRPEPETPPEPQLPANRSVPPAKKSKMTAALLAFLLGGFGAHKFYLGYKGAGLIHLLLSLTVIGAVVNVPLCIIEFLIYVSKSEEDFHQTYVVNKKRFF